MKKMLRSIKLICLGMCFVGLVNIEAYAADSFDSNWQMDATYTWHYMMNNGSQATDAWIHDKTNQDWYLIDTNGNMLSGLIQSYGKYYLLDDQRGTGHYGRLLKDGDTYFGKTIEATTGSTYEGALYDRCLQDLISSGFVSLASAKTATGTQHIEGGEVIVPSETEEDTYVICDGVKYKYYDGPNGLAGAFIAVPKDSY